MDDLISRKAMLKRLEEWNTSDCMDKAFYAFTKSRINEQPTVPTVPNIVARWRREGFGEYSCSWCTEIVPRNEYNYCPNCGAKMKRGV